MPKIEIAKNRIFLKAETPLRLRDDIQSMSLRSAAPSRKASSIMPSFITKRVGFNILAKALCVRIWFLTHWTSSLCTHGLSTRLL